MSDAGQGWRVDCFQARMQAFDNAYAKACASAQPRDWMEAALLAQQFRNVAYAVLTGEAPRQKWWSTPKASELSLKPCPEEPEHLCCYPACNCAMQRLPAEQSAQNGG